VRVDLFDFDLPDELIAQRPVTPRDAARLLAVRHAGIAAILACESLTMASVLVLWSWAGLRGHPLAPTMLLAITASGAAAAVKLVSADVLRPVGLDPTSLYHLAQIVGLVLLYLAVSGTVTVQPSAVASATQSRVT
jgi:hypothetical protein